MNIIIYIVGSAPTPVVWGKYNKYKHHLGYYYYKQALECPYNILNIIIIYIL